MIGILVSHNLNTSFWIQFTWNAHNKIFYKWLSGCLYYVRLLFETFSYSTTDKNRNLSNMNLIFLLNFSCQQNVIKIIWNCVRCDKKNMKRYGTPLYCDIHSFDINNKLIWYFFLHNVMSNRVKHNKSNHKLSTRNMLVFVVVGFVLRCNNFSNAFSG